MTTPQDLPDSGEAHMLSFNHYAYGAVVDWVYRHVAGIAPDRERPGYRHVLLAPKPGRGIDWANAAIETSYGRAAIGWRLDGDTIVVDVELPFGTTGEFTAPATAASTVTVDGRPARRRRPPGARTPHGRRRRLPRSPTRRDPRVANVPKALPHEARGASVQCAHGS